MMPISDRLDKMIAPIAPGWAASRAVARARLQVAGIINDDAANHRRRREESTGSGFTASYRGGVQTRVDSGLTNDRKATGMYSLSGRVFDTIRRRARRLVNNNSLASAMLNASTNFVIGGGTRVQPMTADEEFNRRAADYFDDWWLGRNNGLPDARGMMAGPEIERLMWMARQRDGDVGLILLSDGRVQVIEADLIETPDGRSGDVSVVDGVEVNRIGRPVRYHIRTIDDTKRASRSWAQVGARDFVFMPRLKSFQQVRGQSVFAQSFVLFEQLEGYIDGVTMAARMGAMFGLLIRESAASGFTGLPTMKDGSGTERPIFDMEAAMVKRLNPGDDVIQVKPEQPTTQFEQFVVALVRFAGLEMSLPLELAFMDFSRTTYSSARASMIVAQRAAKAEHTCWAGGLISRLYRWRISKAINDDELQAPAGNEQPWRHRTIQQPFEYLDPVKDAQGDLLSIDAGLKLHEDILLGRGMTFNQWAERRSVEQKKYDDMDIVVGRSTLTREPFEAAVTTAEGTRENDDET